MSEKLQILFMQTRLIRLAAEKWNTSVIKSNDIFAKYDIFQFIEDCFGIFHMEGDAAVLDEIGLLLCNKGVDISAELGWWNGPSYIAHMYIDEKKNTTGNNHNVG